VPFKILLISLWGTFRFISFDYSKNKSESTRRKLSQRQLFFLRFSRQSF
jgi:hypothetical protein